MTYEDEQEIKRLKKELADADYDHKREVESWRNLVIGVGGLVLLAIIFNSIG